jgi:two-component system sensor histidine kinase VicK
MFSKYFIFENPKDIDYALFRKRCLQHNRETSTILAIAALTLFIVLHTVWYFFELSKEFPQEKYFTINLRILSIVSLLVIIYNYLIKRNRITENEYVTQFFVILISLSVLIMSCINSFVISLNPKNNLTPILIGAIATCTLFRFNVRETIFVYLSGLLVFASLFFIWSETQIKFALNFSVVFNIYMLSFIINRTIFTNAYRSFQQLRVIESINISLKNAIKQKDDVLEIVAHDLRGPISNIKELANLIEESDNPLEDCKKFLPLVKESCTNAEEVISDLIAIARIKNIVEPIETVCLNDILKSIYTSTINNNPTRNIEFKDYSEKLYSKIYSEKFKRIIVNLLSNSLKFTPDDKKIEISFYESGLFNIIEIKDQGIGVNKEEVDQLFKKFSSASKTGLKGEESIGLGLFIVKELSELMDGEITFKPTPGGGSTFSLRFPKLIC